MIIEQTIEVPANRRITLEVPIEVPAGKAILTYTVVPGKEEPECTREIWPNNRISQEELKEKLQKLRGSLGENAFGALDGITYQSKVRSEWDD